MNLDQLFKMQKELDERILDRFPELRNEDLLDKKILALQVELGELAQNWRGFKFWSKDQEPRIKDYKQTKCKWCNGSGDDGTGVCPDCKSSGDVYKEYNPLLEEYIDCLHFILSIGNELGKHDVDISCDYTEETITGTFNRTFETIGDLRHAIRNELALEAGEAYEVIFELLVGLGEMLGFTWEQIEQAYLEKNKINHERQANGY